jgi:hypothetical protein
VDNKDNIGELIYRSIKDMSYNAIPKPEADSVAIKYNFNSYGYRCNEFNNQEILILGCSHTEGHGLPIELTWPYLLSKKMNQDYINLAKGGDGAQAQVTKAFQFFKEFYNPKYIFAVFPLTRLEVPLFNMKVKNFTNNNIGKGMFSNKKNTKYSKAPHIAEEILTEEFAIFYNILFIKMLIQYCETNNIKLIWTHSGDMDIKMPDVSDLHNNYFQGNYLVEVIKKECHLEFSNNEFFDHAADYDYWPPGHWGFHKQLHIAESMYNML